MMKEFLKQFWHFLWYDDSILSWVLNIVVAFLLIKFIIYPGLGFIFGTSFPIVAVVSGSMEHDGSFDAWWNSPALCPDECAQRQFYEKFGINEEKFKEYDFPNGFNTGDIMVLVGTPPKYLEQGEIVVFFSAKGEPIIHRIVDKKEQNSEYFFQTKGDHNSHSISTLGLNEVHFHEETIIGKAVLRIPYLGWIKIVFFNAVSYLGTLL